MQSRGFTLIELLMVIAIIAILSAIVLTSLGLARTRGNDAAIQQALNEARKQAELFYYANGNRYSATINDTTTNMCSSAASADGVSGVYRHLENAASIAGVSSIRTCVVGAACVGAAETVTCHACPPGITAGNCGGQNTNAWAIEVPLKDNLAPTGNPDFWCMDSSGYNARNTDGSRLSSGDTRCI